MCTFLPREISGFGSDVPMKILFCFTVFYIWEFKSTNHVYTNHCTDMIVCHVIGIGTHI